MAESPPLLLWLVAISLLTFTGVYLLVRYGYGPALERLSDMEHLYDTVLRRQLFIEIDPRHALWLTGAGIVVAGGVGYGITGSIFTALLCAASACFLPTVTLKHLADKRRAKLEDQLVDGLTTLASGTRAGLNLVQSIELLTQNHRGPIEQEFSQLLREYQLGLDLNDAMRSASHRIGSPLYRLMFTAMQMHRQRGGNASESMDRIAESVREIHRLDGKLDALTAQGRYQAMFMAAMPVVFLVILYTIDAQGVALLLREPAGRMILLGVAGVMALSFWWIRRILDVDI